MKARLEQLNAWLETEIKPVANELDCRPEILKIALQEMGDRSLLALKVPQELGGSGLNRLEYAISQVKLARASGALTFLQTQHQSAGGMLSKSSNVLLQQKFLSQMATGKVLMGVGFSHLRRSGIPMVSAQETNEGYEISGQVPWITGYGFFSHFILGATLADGKELYGILPLQTINQDQKGSIELSNPMELMAISATNTVSAHLNRWCLEPKQVVTIKPPRSIHRSSRHNILNHAWYAIGCAYAGLDILEILAEKKQLDFLQESWKSLNSKVEQCEKKALNLAEKEAEFYAEKLQIRARAINLAHHCSQTAIIASSGAANYLNSSAARIYREALLFSVSGQTTDVMEASIQQLISHQ